MNGIRCAGTGTHLETAASTPERDYGGQRGDRSLQGNSRLYMVITCKQFRSCRLYSWIRFTWTSNMEDGLIFTLYSFSRNWENFILFSCGEWTGQPSQTETVAVRWSPHPQLHGEGRDPRLAVGLTCFTLAISRRKMSSLTKLCSFVSWLRSFT